MRTRRAMLLVLASVALTASMAGGSPANAETARAQPPADLLDVKVDLAQLGQGQRAYVRGLDGRIWYRSTESDHWRAIDGVVGSGPDVAVDHDSATHYIAARSKSDSVVVRTMRNSTTQPWIDLGGSVASAPAVAIGRDSANTIGVFARGKNGEVVFRMGQHGAYGPWRSLGGVSTSAPSVVPVGLTKFEFEVYVRGGDGAVWVRRVSLSGVPTNDWRRLAVTTTTAVSAAESDHDYGIFVYRGSDGALYENPSRRLGGVITSAPDGYGVSTRYAVARGGNGALWYYNSDKGWRSLGGTFF